MTINKLEQDKYIVSEFANTNSNIFLYCHKNVNSHYTLESNTLEILLLELLHTCETFIPTVFKEQLLNTLNYENTYYSKNGNTPVLCFCISRESSNTLYLTLEKSYIKNNTIQQVSSTVLLNMSNNNIIELISQLYLLLRNEKVQKHILSNVNGFNGINPPYQYYYNLSHLLFNSEEESTQEFFTFIQEVKSVVKYIELLQSQNK